MKQKINDSLTLYFTNLYPKQFTKKQGFTYEVTLGIGGNIGDTKKIFHKLFLTMASNAKFHITNTSPILQNPPFGYLEQNDFFNAIIVLQTNEPPYQILKQMQRYENRFKRIRTFQDAPRTLDIDIIFIKKNKQHIISSDPKLILPHHGWDKRESVLIPLASL